MQAEKLIESYRSMLPSIVKRMASLIAGIEIE
jgi:hypothetical protein